MSVKEKLKIGGCKVVSSAMAGVLAVGLMPLPAFANVQAASTSDLTTSGNLSTQAVSTGDYVVAAAYAAAEPAPELLGLSNPNYRNAGEAQIIGVIFGDADKNSAPDPYLLNYMTEQEGIFIGGRQGSPMSRLEAYSTTDSSAAQNAVWEEMPDVILGTGSDTQPANEHDYYESDARIVEGVKDLDAYSYNPIGVTYNRVNLNTMIETMYRLAEAADEAIANSGNTLKARYGEPMDWAKLYEKYITGAKGYVKMAIDKGKVAKRTVALVQNYDATANTYEIIPYGVSEGTATANRYLEAVQGVVTNYFDIIGDDATRGTVAANGKTATVTADMLKNNVDVILLGGQSSTDSTTLSSYLRKDGLLDRTFYCSNMGSGAVFGTTVNSVENAQNVGRILPCVYPELLDQSDMVAFYYDNFYHLKTGALESTIDSMMDGVRNWSNADSTAYLSWSEGDVAGYDKAKVESVLDAGIAYLNSVELTKAEEVLTPTDYMKGVTKPSLADATITVPAGVIDATSGEATPEPTVVYGGATLKKGTDYVVEYSNNKTAGTDGSLIVKPAEGSLYQGNKSATFPVIAANNFTESTVTVAAIADQTYTGGNLTPEPTVTLNEGSKQLVKGTDYALSYENNVDAAASTATNAPKVTITGLGEYAGTIEKTFTIAKKPTTLATGTMVVDSSDNRITNFVEGTSYAKSYGDTFILATQYNGDGTPTFTSSNTSVATVADNGTVEVVADSGSATITAAVAATDNCEAPTSVDVTVIASKHTPTVTIGAASKGKINATYGDEIAFQTAVDDVYANDGGAVTYASSNASVASTEGENLIDIEYVADARSGKTATSKGVKAVGAGTTEITVSAPATAHCDAASAKATLTVSKFTPKITLATSAVSAKVGDEAIDLGAIIDELYDGELTYLVGNENVVKYNSTSGKFDIVGAGSTTVFAYAPSTDNCHAAITSASVSVAQLAPTISISKTSVDKTYGDAAFSLAASVNKEYRGDGGVLAYSSDKTSVATVDAKGKVTIKGVGTAKITVSAPATNKYSAATKTVTVKVAGMEPKFSAPTVTTKSIAMGKTWTIDAKVNSGGTLSYTTSDAKVATVKNGKVTPVAAGTANITIKAAAKGNYKAGSKTVKVTVTKGTQALTFKASQTLSTKASKTKSAAQKLAITKATGNKTAVTYSMSATSKVKQYITGINSSTGALTVKKGTPAGSYKVTVTAKATDTANWSAATKSSTITVKVTK